MPGRQYRHVHYIVDRGAEMTTGVYKHHGRLERDDIVEFGPIRVTSMARTVADLACAGDFAEALVVLDCGLRLGLNRGDLLVQVDRLSGSPGVTTFRNALGYADGKSESVGESISRARMIEMGDIPLPRLQHEFWSSGGVFLARADFDWKGRVIGEFDGKGKYTATAASSDPARAGFPSEHRHYNPGIRSKSLQR
ncbi:hypothetical protein [Nocardia sp. 348MFTsu5.1]|uniref:hypothetical protein n=1 Tax=Nocardia sp. 348MFTsu5.1 TaxID=1172185 RepID=UPI000380F613|nr:hypothetical protein [Nocardia sp. 348MFTsu5.1]